MHKVVTLLACWLGIVSAGSAADKQLNIVVLVGDDWRWDTLGWENKLVKTPHLDALAADGVRFTQARVTTSICCVSRASLLTGQYMSRHQVDRFGKRVADWSQTYPALLHAAGYYTGFVGKFGVGKIEAGDFDFQREYEGKHWLPQPEGIKFHVTLRNRLDALDFLKTRPKDKPFCLSVSFFAPHAQDDLPQQYSPDLWSEGLYADAVIPIPKTATDEAWNRLPAFLRTDHNEGRVRWQKRFDTPEKYQATMKRYYRLVSEVDDVIGKLIAELKSQGVYDNTLVLFTGDNGYFHGEHGLADKWFPYEEALRVPLIIYDPRFPQGRRGSVDCSMALNIDIAPTILNAAKVQRPREMQGKPLRPFHEDGSPRDPSWREEFYYEHPVILGKDRIPRSEAFISGDWRYIYWPDFEVEELFNLADDPYEETNLVDDVHTRERLAELRGKMEQWRERVK